jgi:hypothetical protein
MQKKQKNIWYSQKLCVNLQLHTRVCENPNML